MRGNILILCEDATFARLLELELAAMQFSVFVNSAPTAKAFDVILVDLDSASIPQKAGNDVRMIGFTRHFEVSALDAERRCSMILHRPFQMRVLREEVATVNTNAQAGEERKAEKGAPEISLNGNLLMLEGIALTLRQKEAKVMSVLLANRKTIVSREELSQIIGESSTNRTDVYVCYLRRKIATVTDRPIIKTVRGKGYIID